TRHFATSQVVNMRDKLFMIDCGEGAQMQLRRSKLKFSRLNHIFISHLHGDHCFGLPGLISTFGLLGRTAELHIHSPKGLEELFAPMLAFFCKTLKYQVIFHEFETKQPTLVYEDRSLTVTTIPLKHRNRIKNGCDYTTPEGEVIANSVLTYPAVPPRRYAYCSDTIYRKQIVSQISGVDLLFHEATFAESELARAQETCHTTARQAAQIALDAGVKQLVIGHFSARYENEQVLLEEAQAVFEPTILANENLCISL
ncbi:MAG: ribonuclease Z, partial [Bacteroides sp.]